MNRGASRRLPPKHSAPPVRDNLGASTNKRSVRDRLDSYFQHHRSSYQAAFDRVCAQPAQTVLTSAVVAIALSLPAILILVLFNFQQLGERWDTNPKLTLYLHQRASDQAVDVLRKKLDNDLRVKRTVYISAGDALAEFELASGFGSALSGLEQNPLPSAIEVELQPDYLAPQIQREIASEFQKEAVVEEAGVDLQWVQRFIAITGLVRQVVFFLAGLLVFGALLAIGNTIRLVIENRKEEIVVIKLVGGTNGFVRRPLLYSGGLYGLIGGLLACVIVMVGFEMLAASVRGIAESYQSDFRMRGLSPFDALVMLVSGTLIGWLGAQVAVGRHLAKIEPK